MISRKSTFLYHWIYSNPVQLFGSYIYLTTVLCISFKEQAIGVQGEGTKHTEPTPYISGILITLTPGAYLSQII